jgi:hypothetical protein
MYEESFRTQIIMIFKIDQDFIIKHHHNHKNLRSIF